MEYTHHDIKPLNILTDGINFNKIKIIDFGLTQKSDIDQYGGSPIYLDYYKLHNYRVSKKLIPFSRKFSPELSTPDGSF